MPNFLTVKVLAWIAGALGVVIIGLGVALWAQQVRVGKAQNERDKAKNQVTIALQTIEGQKTVLKECSDRTDKLVADGVKRQVAADQAVAKAQQEARKYQEANKRRDAALKAPTPPGAGCSQAIGSIRQELRR